MCFYEECRFENIPLRGLLNLAILCLINQKPTYGGEIHQNLKKSFGINAPRPLVYILLRRLEKNGLITSTWHIQESGPAKRMYRITEEGLEFLNDAIKRLKKAITIIEKIIDSLEVEKEGISESERSNYS